MRAFVYCRVSTEEQSTDDHYSLANQEQRARAYADSRDWQVVKVRKDVGSGKNTDRPGFHELLADIRQGNPELVLGIAASAGRARSECALSCSPVA